MKRDVSIYITDILENMELAEDLVKGMTYEEFISDKKTNYAVTRCIEIMGEAAKLCLMVFVKIIMKYPGKT